ncbi:MAG: dipeptidase [Bacteroidetes bacterium]|nr:dipeptidase [Bacteroidota bacterium]
MEQNTINDYLNKNKQRFLDELFELLRIPSVSADSNRKNDMLSTAEKIKQRFTEAGADNVEVCPTEGIPVVYAEKIIDKNKPTILVYGHYDVQPADPLELWDSPPFEPVIKKTALHPDGAIFARGSCDDKGQMYMHVKAFELMMKTSTLPCNVKFMIEGEEEVGSPSLGNWVKTNKEKLKADIILISDTSILSNDTPSIDIGLRGLSYMEIELTGPNRDLHSGVYGGGVANPINILCKLIASCHDENNHITIPGFYDKVITETDIYRKELSSAPFNESDYKKDLNVSELWGEKGYNTIERTGIRPTLDVNGIWGGYTGEGAKTVLPSKAFAKVSMRLVPNQNSDEIGHLFKKHFESIAPKSVKINVTFHHGGEPVVVSTNSIGYKAASKALEQSFGKKPVITRGGGSIPIVALFKDVLGLDSMLLGFGLDTDALHSPNEHYGLFNYYKGIETIPLFYKHFCDLSTQK